MADAEQYMDEDLLVKYLLGETDTRENDEVKAWLNASSTNRDRFAELKKVWEQTADTTHNYNTNTAWQKLSTRIDKYEEDQAREPVVRTLRQGKWGWVAAAMIIALVGLFGVFQYYSNPAEIKLVSQEAQLEQILPDQSSIVLNEGSEISYPKGFKGDTRKVKLKGEAFFEVARNAEKPFVIDAGSGEVRVLGTSFNVEAYKGENLKVHVVSGTVQLSLPGATADSSKVILEAGTTGILEPVTKRVYIDDAEYEDALFWMDQKLSFNKTPLPKVFELLEKNYGVRFSSYNKKIDECLLTARFQEESLENILAVISATFNIRFDIQKETVQVISQENNCGEI